MSYLRKLLSWSWRWVGITMAAQYLGFTWPKALKGREGLNGGPSNNLCIHNDSIINYLT
jgi:hypothetical protein